MPPAARISRAHVHVVALAGCANYQHESAMNDAFQHWQPAAEIMHTRLHRDKSAAGIVSKSDDAGKNGDLTRIVHYSARGGGDRYEVAQLLLGNWVTRQNMRCQELLSKDKFLQRY